MTDDKIALHALLERSSDASMLREMIGFAADVSAARILPKSGVRNFPTLSCGSRLSSARWGGRSAVGSPSPRQVGEQRWWSGLGRSL